jgi:methylenetetrahydrofolate reductase (NADPH)
MPFNRFIVKSEAFVKGIIFDCHTCGQCVLSKTGYICPMGCPKGLRNGPCGGTVNGMCEVHPNKKCVWVRIHKRTGGDAMELPNLISSPNHALFNTSSIINWANGDDKHTTIPVDYLSLGKNRKTQPIRTFSTLERKLKQGFFVKTCEIRSPRNANLERLHHEAHLVKDHFDAVNATAYLNGKPSLPSPRVAKELVDLGIDPIAQATCRDHTKTSFISELILNQSNHVNNVLCLTGDFYSGERKIKQVYDMDSSLMLYEARHLQEKSEIHFTGEKSQHPPRPFLGTAINPFSTPANVPIRRLKQKAAAGADFVQTQMIFDIQGFIGFMKKFCDEGLDKDLFMLAGIPVVISKPVLKIIPGIPGVVCPPGFIEHLEKATDIREEGVKVAREMVEIVKEIKGVSGVHLMLLGSDHSVLRDVVQGL